MSVQQVATGVLALTPASEETVYTQVGAGALVVLLNMKDLVATDEFIVRHYVTFPVGENPVIGSRTIEHSATTDDTWSGTAGADDIADGWEAWPMGFGDDGGWVSVESLSGSYDLEFTVLLVGGPAG